jgi:divalent metal cation (Fe/Co/Zn/Cd) transporter
MSERHHIIPIWFFVGLLLFVYGFLILVSGLAEWSRPPNTVLAELHAAVWWGALLVVLGLIYCVKYYPRRET